MSASAGVHAARMRSLAATARFPRLAVKVPLLALSTLYASFICEPLLQRTNYVSAVGSSSHANYL